MSVQMQRDFRCVETPGVPCCVLNG